MLRIYCLLLLSLGGWGNALLAQDNPLPEEYYTVDDGLSDRNVHDILQTSDGIVWLATTNGLNRFDGYDFLTFNHFPNSKYRISEPDVRSLHLDTEGKIVLLYFNNYALFERLDPSTLEVETVEILPDKDNGVAGRPRMITVNSQGEILVLSEYDGVVHIYRYEGGGRFDRLAEIRDGRIGRQTPIHFLQLHDGRFVISDDENGLRLFSPSGALLHQFQLTGVGEVEGEGAYPGVMNVLHQDRQGKLWYAVRQQRGVFYIDIAPARFDTLTPIDQDKGKCTSLWEDERGNVLTNWCADLSRNYPLTGLSCRKTNGEVRDFDYLLANSRYIVCAYGKDFFRTLFLGIDTGLKIVQNRRLPIQSYADKKLGGGGRGTVIRGITSKNGMVYISQEFSYWLSLDAKQQLLDTLQIIDERTGLPLNLSCGRSLHLDDDGYLWGVTCTDGQSTGILFRYDFSTCQAQTYHYDYRFEALTLDEEGGVWLGVTPQGAKGQLIYFDPSHAEFRPYSDREGANPFAQAKIRYLLETSDGLLWVGTENGLYAINREKSSTVQAFYSESSVETGLKSNVVYALYEDEQQNIWVGTTNGFSIYSPSLGQFESYTQKDGLASNIVCGFVPADRPGCFWISTFNGLSYFDRAKKSFRNFFRKDGLAHDEFNRFAFHKDKMGRVYLGTVNGLNAFHSEDIIVDQGSATPIISKISRYNVDQGLTEQYNGLSNLEELIVYPGDSYFSIHLSMPDYVSPRRNQYTTFLENYDKKWSFQTSNPVLRYNKLPKGEYTLRIRGANAYGNVSEEELRLPIYVKPVFYKTNWFYTLCVILVLCSGYLLFKYRLEQKLKMERIRTRLSSDLHDEVSGLLSGIAMQTDVLQMTVKDEQSRDRIAHIGEVSRKALSKMSDVIWSIDSRKDKVEELVKRMQEHADEILTPLDIAYQIRVDKEIDQSHKLPVTLRQNLYFIYKEAVNNVVKHANANQVLIALKNEDNQFKMSIKDNGRGVVSSTKGQSANGGGQRNGQAKKSGQGLSNLKMRAYRIEADLDIHTSEAGFEVLLTRKRLY